MNSFRPPFRIIPGQSAEDAAVDIVDTFISIETFPDKVHRVFKEITGCIGTGPLDPLIVAGYSLAKAIDDAADIQDKPYHNSLHTCEVMLSSYFISLLAGLNKQETAEIILAALIHDFQHDGQINGDILFRLER